MRRIAMILAGAAMVAACRNPVTPADDHEEPAGVAVFQGGTEIVRAIDGTVDGALPDVITGTESELLTVVFLDEHGDPLDLAGEEDLYLLVTSGNATIAEWEGVGYTGRIVGGSTGNTELTFVLMHGEPPSGGHPDFTSMALEVEVVPQ